MRSYARPDLNILLMNGVSVYSSYFIQDQDQILHVLWYITVITFYFRACSGFNLLKKIVLIA